MRLGRFIGLDVVLIVLLTASVAASEWRGRTFELRQDRLYFPVGEETRVFENSRCSIIRSGDTLFTGFVEHSWEGVSVSTRTGGYFDTLSLDGTEAVIVQAEIDSGGTIVIGSDLGNLVRLIDSTNGGNVNWVDYDDTNAMQDDFAAGMLEAVVTFSAFGFRSGDRSTLSSPSPFMAVVIPNVGRRINYRGELSTSLYYRFDESLLALCFRGDEVSFVERLFSSSDDTVGGHRWYDFDPSRGKKLLDRISPRLARVSLYSGNCALDGLARCFADILSRDRCAVEIARDRHRADISIDFVPYQEHSPKSAIDTLLALMRSDAVVDTRPSEYLQQIETELAQLTRSPSYADSARHLETVSRIMAEDLGLFPLFRPTLYVHTQKRLKNIVVTPDGRIDCSAAVILRLPMLPKGRGR